MQDLTEFTDSTDWLPTPLAALAPLDASLRCQVCKDFFTTPMITSCSHTFCSLCIRRCLSQEGRCPACREADQEIKLRRNWAVEELVHNFTGARKGLLVFASNLGRDEARGHATADSPTKKRKLTSTADRGVERRNTRSQTRKSAPTASQQSTASSTEPLDDSDEYNDDHDRDAGRVHRANGTENHGGLVDCPCCHRRIQESVINAHLDKCIAGDASPADVSAPPPTPLHLRAAVTGGIAYMRQTADPSPARLPFINYSLFNDGTLRKKLRDLGIPHHGSKDLMRRRHTEWVNLWNANCDSANRATKRQLMHELKIWEDTLGRQGERPMVSSGFMAKDFNRELHMKVQKSNFDDLIKHARQKRTAPANGEASTGDDSKNRDGSTDKPTSANEQLDGESLTHPPQAEPTSSGPLPSTYDTRPNPFGPPRQEVVADVTEPPEV